MPKGELKGTAKIKKAPRQEPSVPPPDLKRIEQHLESCQEPGKCWTCWEYSQELLLYAQWLERRYLGDKYLIRKLMAAQPDGTDRVYWYCPDCAQHVGEKAGPHTNKACRFKELVE